jgi:hypothetical protein
MRRESDCDCMIGPLDYVRSGGSDARATELLQETCDEEILAYLERP